MKMKEMEYKCESVAEVLYEGKYHGYHFVIVSYGFHPCAYVEVPKSHPWYGRNYSNDDILNNVNVHGGLTWGDDLEHVLGERGKNRWFLGWDYAHAGDFEGYYLSKIFKPKTVEPFLNDKKWTTAEIYKEVKSVIRQIEGYNVSDKENN